MLSKCANPACDAKLHYLHEGRIFRIDTESLAHASHRAKPSVSAVRGASREVSRLQVTADRGGAYRPEYFWLCGDCSRHWTVALQNASVVVVAIPRPKARHAAAS